MQQAERRTCSLALRRGAGFPHRGEPEDLEASQAQRGACHSEGMSKRHQLVFEHGEQEVVAASIGVKMWNHEEHIVYGQCSWFTFHLC